MHQFHMHVEFVPSREGFFTHITFEILHVYKMKRIPAKDKSNNLLKGLQ